MAFLVAFIAARKKNTEPTAALYYKTNRANPTVADILQTVILIP